MNVVLAVDGIFVAYRKVEALRGVSLRVDAGEIVTVVGANGAGKSTLLRAISRLVPVKRGRITLQGEDVTQADCVSLVRRGVLHVPERRELFAGLTVFDNLRIGGDVAGSMEQLPEVYRLFPVLEARAQQPSGNLSGGEQQMLAIGRALMARPRILLLDEPSLGLAPKLVSLMFETVKILRDAGVTVLLVEQNAVQALRTADRGYVMSNGRVVLEGRGADLSADPDIVGAYLGRREHSPPGQGE